ncbi:hypothetical protein Ddc_14621 [Ditylenchus destructor]|nr:hypothetical protein Ddc_14621 [Ditylenchus destructor]
MKRELYSQSILSERLLLGEPIRLRKPKYREAEQRLAELRQGYAAATAFVGDAEIGPDAIKEILIPLARRMAYYCATFVNRETLLENSNIQDPDQDEQNSDNEENGEIENNDQIDDNDLGDNSELFDFMAQDFY